MTQALTRTRPRKGAPIFVAGWTGVALFAAVALITNGLSAWAFSGLIAGVAVGMIAWYRMTTGRPAVLVGLVLGVLVILLLGAATASNLTANDLPPAKRYLNDIFGLGAGLLILVGSVLGLGGRRRATR
ncbi:hypothetical protein [Nocardioides zhouii]|uniref:Uncharacterized protein n=1 Tax=Nocardioides zhouii TaxID=1168729 RepID=A0A4Q2TCE4_9ACTN|nr:hypothetical protein [Nocardioides zhouii]RYC14589.1 hypothetical protein EUA94_00235 [Nocardioides zhouii]